MTRREVVIIGAGPAGLSAALESMEAGLRTTILECDPKYVGGLSRTIEHNGLRFDVGAHRFFTKSPEIIDRWHASLPNDFIRIRRLTRILYRDHFFQYPLRAGDALLGLGISQSVASIISYLRRQVSPIAPEKSFEDWVRNRFGDKLYCIFFKTYTEKVWGIPCSEISSDWASQRIKGLSLWKAALNALAPNGTFANAPKTLIDEFQYPRLGPGMLWEKVRNDVINRGGRIFMGRRVKEIERQGDCIRSVISESPSGVMERWLGDDFIVSMPLKDCISAIKPNLSEEALIAGRNLFYRDFLLVILIINRGNIFPDQWIYVHSPDVKVGRIENFNNWGTDMVPDRNITCLEFEYFCSKGDPLWSMDDKDVIGLAKREMHVLKLAREAEVIDAWVMRVEKAYPVYDQNYRENVSVIRKHIGNIVNLQVVGRNGMHKYNNQDHSMLTGILAARNLAGSNYDLWRVNTDAEYQEEGGNSPPNDAARLTPRRIDNALRRAIP